MPREIMPDNKFVVSRERHFLVYHNGLVVSFLALVKFYLLFLEYMFLILFFFYYHKCVFIIVLDSLLDIQHIFNDKSV